jgi:hypothetical protein
MHRTRTRTRARAGLDELERREPAERAVPGTQAGRAPRREARPAARDGVRHDPVGVSEHQHAGVRVALA